MVVGKLNEMKIKTLSVNFKMKKKNENKERKKDKDGENWREIERKQRVLGSFWVWLRLF